jgi:hypothetical protein
MVSMGEKVGLVEGSGSSFAFPSRTVYHVHPGEGNAGSEHTPVYTD